MSSEHKSAHDGFFAFHGIWAPGVRLFRALGFPSKALILSCVFVLPMLGLMAWQLTGRYESALQQRKDATRQHVEVAHGAIEWAHAREQSGELTREQAQQVARQLVGRLRYQDSEYFWINDMAGRMVMHPVKSELDGRDVLGMKDPNGFAMFEAMIRAVRQEGRGFVAYQWPKPGRDKPVDKVSFVQGYAPWGWLVGSGIYVDDLRAEFERQLLWSAGVIAAALLTAGYLFLAFYRVMDGGLREVTRHLGAMTRGDLTTCPSPWGRDEAARLMFDLATMQTALRNMVARMRSSSDAIVSSSDTIDHSASDLAVRTSEAAASLDQSAVAVEQISATVKSGAALTAEAADAAQRNAAVAAHGGQVMQELVKTMEAIRDSSKRISEIISTIDSIAFQTNILALNAAVEAARAGDEGKGFAVVASEVRMLALRSATAAKEISTLIETSVRQVSAGTAVVQKAGETIGSIVQSAERVDTLLGEVARGAREQSEALTQVEDSVNRLDRTTQDNRQMGEKTAAAGRLLKAQATALAEEVSRFELPAS